MTRKVYNNGDVFYAEDANAIAYPIPDGQDFIGHGPQIIDDYLSSNPTQLKSNFYGFYNRLQVSYQGGLTFNYLGGTVLLNNGNIVAIGAGTIQVPNNTTVFIYVDNTGAVQQSTTLPNESFPLAKVSTASGTLSGGILDLRNKIVDRIAPSTIPVQQFIPSGTGVEFWGSSLPSGWLWADGSFYDPSAYPTLFAAIGYTFGQSGAQFAVPDKRGRFSVGAGARVLD